MFEVLLQADQALASGALDQAERSYWQLVELDPTNAIAVAGLARVSLERGDQRLARTFADRALAMDPESVAAKKILETLKGGAAVAPSSDLPDLPLLAAQRLEALGRRRARVGEDESGGAGSAARAPDARPTKRAGAAEADARKPFPHLPTGPLSERREAGRRAAAAAAVETAAAEAEAPPRPQAPPRPKAHQALGDRARRHLLPEDVNPQPRVEDPFAAAESAAAIEAVDETDDVAMEEPVGRAGRADAAAGRATDRQGAVLGAVDATNEEESIAMRVALVSDAAQLAAEADAAQLAAEAEDRSPGFDEDALDVAEMMAAGELAPAPSRPIDLAALEAELEAAELRAATAESGDHGASTPADAEAELAAAELASAELATAELVSEQIAEAELEAAEIHAFGGAHEPPVLPPPPPPTAEEATEKDAEAAALREAVAMVLGGEAAANEARDPALPPAGSRPSTSTRSRQPTQGPSAESHTHVGPAAEGAAPTDSGTTTEPPRKGLLRRLRGD